MDNEYSIFYFITFEYIFCSALNFRIWAILSIIYIFKIIFILYTEEIRQVSLICQTGVVKYWLLPILNPKLPDWMACCKLPHSQRIRRNIKSVNSYHNSFLSMVWTGLSARAEINLCESKAHGCWVFIFCGRRRNRTEQEGREMSIPLLITITEQFHQKLTSTERLGHTHTHLYNCFLSNCCFCITSSTVMIHLRKICNKNDIELRLQSFSYIL